MKVTFRVRALDADAVRAHFERHGDQIATQVRQAKTIKRVFRKPIDFSRMIRRVAATNGITAAAEWTKAVVRHQKNINMAALRSAIASKSAANIEAVIGVSKLQAASKSSLQPSLTAAAGMAGRQSAAILSAHGIRASFNVSHPNVVSYARTQSAALVVGLPKETKQIIAEVIAQGAANGLTTAQQAQAIKQVVGLPPNWAQAPGALGQEIRDGQVSAATSRRLSARAKQQIRSRIKAGTVTEEFVTEMSEEYAESLVHRRSLNIARTESVRAAHHGLTESWKQAQEQGALPDTSRRYWIVTPDERLSPEHARIPSMNPDGRDLDEPFHTPDGEVMQPPSRPNCRCSIGLLPGGGRVTEPLEEEDAAVEEATPLGGEIPPEELPKFDEAPSDVTPGQAFPHLSDEEVLQLPSSAFPRIQEHDETIGRFIANGRLTPERQRLHDAIQRKMIGDVKPLPVGQRAEVTVMGGGPASGKSVARSGMDVSNHVVVDPDAFKQLLPEFREGTLAGNKAVASLVHEESSFAAKELVKKVTSGNYNVLVDGTGDSSFENLASKVAQYRRHGHRVTARYVTVDTEEAVARAYRRGLKDGRFVPEAYNREVHKSISQIMPRIADEGLFDELTLIDTNDEAKVILRTLGKKVEVTDEKAWQRFLAKGQDNKLLNDAFQIMPGTNERVSFVLGGPQLKTSEVYNYLGAYGREWKPAGLPPGIRKMAPKQCYANASKLVLEHPEWRYVEGIAYSSETGGLPFMHAWAVTPEGFVVDATWKNPAGARYFGVSYERSAYLKHIRSNKFYGVLGGDAEAAEKVIARGAKGLRQKTRDMATRTDRRTGVPTTVVEPAPVSAPEIGKVEQTKLQYQALQVKLRDQYRITLAAPNHGKTGSRLHRKLADDLYRRRMVEYEPQLLSALEKIKATSSTGRSVPVRRIQIASQKWMEEEGHGTALAFFRPKGWTQKGTVVFNGDLPLNIRQFELSQTGWVIGRNFEELALHEFMHGAHHRVGRGKYWHPVNNGALTEAQKNIARETSRYAATNAWEYVAEVGAKMISGRPVSAQAHALYTQLGGPKIRGLKVARPRGLERAPAPTPAPVPAPPVGAGPAPIPAPKPKQRRPRDDKGRDKYGAEYRERQKRAREDAQGILRRNPPSGEGEISGMTDSAMRAWERHMRAGGYEVEWQVVSDMEGIYRIKYRRQTPGTAATRMPRSRQPASPVRVGTPVQRAVAHADEVIARGSTGGSGEYKTTEAAMQAWKERLESAGYRAEYERTGRVGRARVGAEGEALYWFQYRKIAP